MEFQASIGFLIREYGTNYDSGQLYASANIMEQFDSKERTEDGKKTLLETSKTAIKSLLNIIQWAKMLTRFMFSKSYETEIEAQTLSLKLCLTQIFNTIKNCSNTLWRVNGLQGA